ncbi:hypothetical protein QYF36_016132 [Acer negundo]|nr:hypothetical protein QYF36_016132 [Acer negundo]
MTRRMQFSILMSHYSLCLLLLLLLPINHAISEPEECQTYIIHMDHSQKPASFLTHESWHQSIVNSLLSTADNREMLLYSYNHVMHGFSASLTPSQLSAIEKSPAHLATYPESFGKLFTTYSPKDNVSKAMCKASALDQNEVAGKVVLCDNSTKIDVFDQMEEVERAGAYAGIFLVDISDLEPDDFIIPSLILDTASGTLVRKYVTEDSKAKVKGYDEKQMKSILRRSQWNCSQEPTDLNYPSFMAIFNNETVKKFTRVVTNVGDEEAVYHANLKLPTGMKITIEPSTLTFTGKYQKQNFVLSIETDKEAPGMVYGFLNWIDQHNHTVSSPIVVIKT